MIGLRDLQGHWRRAWLRAPGVEDRDTRVSWMQGGALFADLRVPATRPALEGARALSDLDPEALLGLMAAEGFAGTITLEGDVCTWNREVNWHGEPQGVDAGRMRFDAAGDLIEDGVHADYAELWQRASGEGLNASRVAADGFEGVLLRSESLFLIGLGRPGAPASAPLVQALERGERPAALVAHFASHYVLGHWDGALGIADLATNPFLENRPFLERGAGGRLIWHAVGFHGTETELPLSVNRPGGEVQAACQSAR